MATAHSTEARELNLLDKVELKIALADSEEKLQSVLNIYLTPLLLKLASEHVTVRNKVRDSRINTIVNPQIKHVPSAMSLSFRTNLHRSRQDACKCRRLCFYLRMIGWISCCTTSC